MDLLVTEEFSSAELAMFADNRIVHVDPSLWQDRTRLKTLLSAAKAVLVRHQTPLTADALRTADPLQCILRWGAGLDNIDVEAASRLGIVVAAPREANAVTVAEYTMGLLLAGARRITLADRTTRAGSWDRRSCMGTEVQGSTVVICGFGRIGRLVAARASAFGARILVYNHRTIPDAEDLAKCGATLANDLPSALSQADFLSIHTPLTPVTHHLIGRSALAATKPGAFLINTSRGSVVDEIALLQSLKSRHLSGAALDVRETEPPAVRGELESLDNVIVTPHCAGLTIESQARMLHALLGDLASVLSGGAATHFVNFPRPRRPVTLPHHR